MVSNHTGFIDEIHPIIINTKYDMFGVHPIIINTKYDMFGGTLYHNKYQIRHVLGYTLS